MIDKLKNYRRLVKNKMEFTKIKYLLTLDDESIKWRKILAESKERSTIRKNLPDLDNATVSYNSALDRVIFTIMSTSAPSEKFDIEIERNSHEDRKFRKMLLSQGLISYEESGALPVRRIIPKLLSTEDMPDPLYDDEYTLGQREHGKEIVWESSVYPHMFIFGGKGTGKTNLTRNLLTYAFHKANSRVHEIDLSIEDPNPQTLYRNMSRGCKTTIDDALEVITNFHDIMRSAHKNEYDHHRDEFLLIENLDLVLPAVWVRPGDSPDINLEKKQKIQKMLGEIIEYGNLVKNMHLVVTTSLRSFAYLLPFKDKERVCYVSLGRISPENSHYLFNDDGGYFVSPYIKGRGYIRFGTKSGMEFQSYFIEDDYMNHIAYTHQLRYS